MKKIEYVPNNWYNNSVQQKDNPNHDAHDLCYEGFLFKRQRINKNSINWLCKVPICPGSVTLSKSDETVERSIGHVFVAWHEQFDNIKQIENKFRVNCKIRCETEPELSAARIFLDEQTKIVKESGVSYEELAIALPSYASFKPALDKRKKKSRPKLPQSLVEMKISGEYTKTALNEKFLILNKKNKLLVFASPTQIEALSKATHWYADGTFRSASKFYYQLYILHAYVNNFMINEQTAKA
jgi:hypothetical protein